MSLQKLISLGASAAGSKNAAALAAQHARRGGGAAATSQLREQQQVRYHHPDPFNPKVTKGWKAALKVRTERVLSASQRRPFSVLWTRSLVAHLSAHIPHPLTQPHAYP